MRAQRLGLLVLALAMAAAPAHAATMTIIPGAGFSDSTPATPVGGNTGTTVGAQRLIALQYAADSWGAALSSSVEIRIDARFISLSCAAMGGTLGFAASNVSFRNFSGAPVADTWYPVALANALAGTDLCPPSSSCTTAGFDPDDIDSAFQIDVGNTGCFEGYS